MSPCSYCLLGTWTYSDEGVDKLLFTCSCLNVILTVIISEYRCACKRDQWCREILQPPHAERVSDINRRIVVSKRHFINCWITNRVCGFLCRKPTTRAQRARGRQVKQNKIRRRLSTFKIPSGTQWSSHDTELAFMVRSNYREKS